MDAITQSIDKARELTSADSQRIEASEVEQVAIGLEIASRLSNKVPAPAETQVHPVEKVSQPPALY